MIMSKWDSLIVLEPFLTVAFMKYVKVKNENYIKSD
tara:strand:+ start:330 stop:437 length:108 start_codon:yes stop_codon:yes gene_type:complete